MGLLDDAMREFQAALGSPAHRVDGLHMLGLCALDAGRSGEAVGHLQQALSLPGLGSEQELAVRFGLGRAFEALGDLQHARDAYERVMEIDPLFCDVERQLALLEEKKTEAPATAEPAEAWAASASPPDDRGAAETAPEVAGFESFADLLVDAEARADAPAPPAEAPAPDLAPRSETPAPDPAPSPVPAATPRKTKKRIGFL
jgi:hypothetical protein